MSAHPHDENTAAENTAAEKPRRLNRGPHTVAYQITVDAPAAELFGILIDPHRHHELDGSGTIGDTAIGPRRIYEGDRFRIDMRKFGVPYSLTMRVTEIVEDRVVEWRHPAGHRWRWELEPSQDGTATVVTECYDAAGQHDLVRRGLELLRVPADNANGIKASLQKVRDTWASRSD
ncbi:SRPBCC family protein [Nesterenkonia aerolata]|uniref:SRPBCC domain-containing protein n=1 Tax=Nesterenkonia aerolata TaxID=3074079 RepID=A0ABU2DS19_9MICC|nr:SRPBCC family protein [Nesterenkonia sp. LY-0111]MDR8019308.1 SRPBCC domain-containing protein [Nesterenkonia sp. LY-0111]